MCLRVCLEMAVLELPDVEWATCLSRSKHKIEINQNQGNLHSNMRREVSLSACLFVGG